MADSAASAGIRAASAPSHAADVPALADDLELHSDYVAKSLLRVGVHQLLCWTWQHWLGRSRGWAPWQGACLPFSRARLPASQTHTQPRACVTSFNMHLHTTPAGDPAHQPPDTRAQRPRGHAQRPPGAWKPCSSCRPVGAAARPTGAFVSRPLPALPSKGEAGAAAGPGGRRLGRWGPPAHCLLNTAASTSP
jgi:hypothetical protein